MCVSGEAGSKTLTKGRVLLAFHNAVATQQKVGCVRGTNKLGLYKESYLFSIFARFGVIE